ncbi:MAG: sulfatase/phosphatase domain-containing protein, partial [Pseudomonadota bacterium]
HGDNVGARGLWGKSNLYEESVAIPMILAGPGIPQGTSATPVSLLDLSATIAAQFGAPLDVAAGVTDLATLAAGPDDPNRPVFSEYHAAGAVSGAYMLRRGRWKYHHYVGFAPELFDLQTDPEELSDRAADPACAAILAEMEAALRDICDPDAVNARAFADQADLIAGYGGRAAALNLGAPGATPPPATEQAP